MISTQNLSALPDKEKLRSICKAIAALEVIIHCDSEGDFHDHYYTSNWNEGEEVFEWNNEQGERMLILFKNNGCVINGFSLERSRRDKKPLTTNLPAMFDEFMWGEPVNSIGTTFCIWTTEGKNWTVGEIDDFDDYSDEMLRLLDGNPETSFDWAIENLYDVSEEEEIGLTLDFVKKMYNGEVLTKAMVSAINVDPEDWDKLKKNLEVIDYPYDFSR